VFSVAIDEWLKVHELEETTREGYEAYTRNYINPALGDEPVSKISARVLEQFYAELRRCRTRCDGRLAIEHREWSARMPDREAQARTRPSASRRLPGARLHGFTVARRSSPSSQGVVQSMEAKVREPQPTCRVAEVAA
jgi:hypothetical protein